MQPRPHVAAVLLLLAGFSALPGKARGATTLDMIGDLSAYVFGLAPDAEPSQLFPDFPSFDCTVVEDFSVTGSWPRITMLSILYRAVGGFESFDAVEGYSIGVYDSAAAAGSTLLGNVGARFVPKGSSVTVVPLTDPATNEQYGMVKLEVDIPLPGPGTYWLGVSPRASFSTAGQFLVAGAGGNGAVNSGGSANAVWANPGLGFDNGALRSLEGDYAYSIVTVPEPGAVLLGAAGASLLLVRRRRRRNC